ncbi:MAG: LON peptidase substrate-binding domain-containing protein [Marmoricola sp.]
MPTVPLFPLNTVLFPGTVTPLHIFEDRYRAMMRDLLAIEDPAERTFGAVAIREGYEVGEHGVQHAHRVGTLVQVTSVERHDDGSFDIEATGRQRLRTVSLLPGEEYLRAEVELLAEARRAEPDPASRLQAERTRRVFERYRGELSGLRGGQVLAGDLPGDPDYLSYSLAAACLLTLRERQQLLEADTAPDRLALLAHMLREEMRAMRALPSLPATEVARTRWSPN